MQKAVFDQDDGFLEVQIGEVSVVLDVYEVNSRICEINKKHEGRPAHENNEAVVVLMESLGLPRCSQQVAIAFAASVSDAVEGIKKKHDPTPASPDSSVSTPSN